MANNLKQHGCRACGSRYILDLYYISRSTKMQRKQSKMLLPARESFFYFLCTIFIRGPQILSPRKVYIVSFEQCFLQILDNLRVPKQFWNVVPILRKAPYFFLKYVPGCWSETAEKSFQLYIVEVHKSESIARTPRAVKMLKLWSTNHSSLFPASLKIQ